MSGSIGLNVRFTAAVQALVGEAQWRSLQGSRALAIAQKLFDEEIKRSFKDDGKEFFVDFPMASLRDDKERGLVRQSWKMTG